MTIKIICEDPSKNEKYVEHIVNKCMWVEGLPMKVVLFSDETEENQTPTVQQQNSDTEAQKPTNENLITKEGAIIENRGLKIDTRARRVWIGNEELNLTRTEFDILAFLAENPHRVLAKEEFYNRIWAGVKTPDKKESTLTVHVNNLRKKIRCDREKPKYIQNIWGVGYRFLA